MTRKLLLIACVAGLLVGGSPRAAMAGEGFFHRPVLRKIAQTVLMRLGAFGALGADLDITAEQRASIHALVKANQKQGLATTAEVVKKHRVLKNAVLDGRSEAEIKKAAAALGEEIGKAAVKRARVVKQIKGVLTEEQATRIRWFIAGNERALDSCLRDLSASQ